MSDWLWIVLGLVILTGGAEVLVRGASRLARLAGLSPLVVGLTVVAYGTSAPEVAVSLKAALSGQADLALGNVVGSNTFNVLFILGLSALVAPLAVSGQLVRLDVPVMIGVVLLGWALGADGSIGRIDGAALALGGIAYTAFLVRKGRRDAAQEPPPPDLPRGPRSLLLSAGAVVLGLAFLVLGGRWLVSGAVGVARGLGVSELLIGLTIVSAGTSLPEVATSVMATIRGEREIAIGNVVGSNIFNVLVVLGLSAAVSGDVAVSPAVARFDYPVMAAVCVACLPVFFTEGRVDRWEGALFLAYYAAYVGYLALKDAEHQALPLLSEVTLAFVLPATVLGVGLSVLAALRARRRA